MKLVADVRKELIEQAIEIVGCPDYFYVDLDEFVTDAIRRLIIKIRSGDC